MKFENEKIPQQPISKQNTKKAGGCWKPVGITFLVLCGIATVGTILEDPNEVKLEEIQSEVQSEELTGIAKYEKELENPDLTKTQRAEIEIDIKNEKIMNFADKNISAWDRSNPKLVRAVKKVMNDPKSFEHVETTFDYKKNTVEGVMLYRGSNAFGGIVINSITGVFDYEGNLIDIKE